MEIGIAAMLQDFNQSIEGTRVKTFSITFVRISGAKKGQAKTVERAMKYSKPTGGNTSGKSANLRESLLIRISDLTTGRPVDIYIPSIIKYNGNTIRH